MLKWSDGNNITFLVIDGKVAVINAAQGHEPAIDFEAFPCRGMPRGPASGAPRHTS